MFCKIATCFFIFFLSSKSIGQEQRVYKDFNNINLDNLAAEGPVGDLMMKAHLNVNIDSTLHYISQAEKLAFKIKDTLLIPYINYHFGYAYYNKQKFSQSEAYLNKCIFFGNNYSLPGMLFESYNLLGLIKKDQTLFNLALDYFKKALIFAPTLSEKLYLKINISGIYLDTNKTSMAKLYLDEVLDFNNKNPKVLDPYWMSYCYLCYSKVVSSYQDSYYYIDLAIKEAEKIQDMHVLLHSKIELSQLYLEHNYYNLALALSELNLKSALEYNLTDSVVRIELILARIYFKLNQFSKSLGFLQSIKSKKHPDSMTLEIYKLSHENFYKLGNYDKAYFFAARQIKYLDSLLINREDKAYVAYAQKYQTDKKIQENLLLTKDNQINKLIIIKEKNKRYLISIISLLLAIVSFVFYYRYRLKKSVTEILKYKNNIISKQNKDLDVANKTKQRLFAIVAHDLINPFNAILGYIDVLKQDYQSLSDSQRESMIAIISKYANQNYNLTKNLLVWSRAQQNRILINKVKLNLKNTLEAALEPYSLLATNKNIKTVINIDPLTTIWADKDCFNTIAVNLYSNAIKYSNMGGVITIDSFKTINCTSLRFTDNGVGMSQTQLNNIFSLLITTTTKGTNHETGSGFGLLICNELTLLQKGKLKVNSKINQGTMVTIELPNPVISNG